LCLASCLRTTVIDDVIDVKGSVHSVHEVVSNLSTEITESVNHCITVLKLLNNLTYDLQLQLLTYINYNKVVLISGLAYWSKRASVQLSEAS